MGGGVGKALSGLIAQASISGSGVKHLIVSLEEPEKSQFVDLVRGYGCKVIVRPSKDRLEKLIKNSDIVQLEWWNHPATIKCLCSLSVTPVRLLTWCHISGLHNPIIPKRLILASHKFLFTSRCSFEAKEVMELGPEIGDRLDVVSSSGGFSELPDVWGKVNKSISVGYIGSLNFTKLHPRYIEYLAAVEIPGFKVRIIGDLTNLEVLNQQCDSSGKTGMLEFRGYSSNVASELASINVLAYLLNPEHYGTTENALLEAMAMGVVPVVLDNPAEKAIVENDVTGLVVHSPREFAKAIDWLAANPGERVKIGARAARFVRETFTAKRMSDLLNGHYRKVMVSSKRVIDFRSIFGSEPADWFLSCQANPGRFSTDTDLKASVANVWDYSLNEKTKGSVFHFLRHFPDDIRLVNWAQSVERLQ